MAVADLGETLRHRPEGEVRRVAVVHFIPGERRGYAGVGRRAHRVGRRHGPVLRILVVIHKDALALLLPPLAGGEPVAAAFHLARERERRAPHLVKAPAGFDADEQVHPA